jgi:small-conductance mechanosensitive channel
MRKTPAMTRQATPVPRCRFALGAAAAAALRAPAALAQDNPVPLAASAVTSQLSALSSIEFWLAVVIIAFGFVVLVMQYTLLRRARDTEPEDILRLFTVTIIIIGTLSLIAIGYSSQQIAPALGLFGTILGYLLGKSDERGRGRRATAEAAAPGQREATPPE